MWNHMNGFAHDWGWGWVLFGGLHMILFWVLVIGAIVLIARMASGNRLSRRPDPLAILKERYARGEIDKAQYEEMRKDLER